MCLRRIKETSVDVGGREMYAVSIFWLVLHFFLTLDPNYEWNAVTKNANFPFYIPGSSLPRGLVWAASTVDQDNNFMILGGFQDAGGVTSDKIYLYKQDMDQWVEAPTTLSREKGALAIKVKYSICPTTAGS